MISLTSVDLSLREFFLHINQWFTLRNFAVNSFNVNAIALPALPHSLDRS